MKLTVKNFSCTCACSSYNIQTYYSACNTFSQTFTEGVYVLKGEIDCGAWSFVSAISNACTDKKIFEPAQILIDDQPLSYKSAATLACCVHENRKPRFANVCFLVALQRLIRKQQYPLSAEDLFELFAIPEDMQKRKIKYLGMYLPCYVAMYYLILGKKVFVSAWQGQYGFDLFILNKIAVALQQVGCIFLIPSSEKNLFPESYKSIKMISLFESTVQIKYNSSDQKQ